MNPILARFQDEPALIDITSQARFESCVARAATTLEVIESKEYAGAGFWPEEGDWLFYFRPYQVDNGVLMIPVKGVLLNNFPYAINDYATGYEYINEALKRGMDDANVKAIALMIDSPGGMVSGNFDLVDKMFAMRGKKPIKAFANDSAYSAAYSIASAADTIAVSRSGGVGSIGIVTMHVDQSKAMESYGFKVTYIFAGKHKVDGNPYEPLPAAVKATIQTRIDALYSEFVAIVARNRNMEEKAVRATEAATFMATEAIANGLADEAGSFESAFTAFVATVNPKEEDNEMANDSKAGITEEALATAVAAARAEGKKEGSVEAMARINAIIGSEPAKGRPSAALNFALKSSMVSDEAIALLATLPEEKAAAPVVTPQGAATAGVSAAIFQAAMEGTTNPNVGAEGKTSGDTNKMSVADETRTLAAAYGLAGFAPEKKE